MSKGKFSLAKCLGGCGKTLGFSNNTGYCVQCRDNSKIHGGRNWDKQGQPCKGCGKPCNARGNGVGYCRSCASKFTDPRSVFVTGTLSHDYATAHDQVEKLRGKAAKHECFMLCGYMGQTWARIHGTDGRLPIHYVPMCYRCHNKYDYETMQSKESRNKRARPGHRDYSGSRMKELWADPEWRARQIERQKAGIENSTKR